METSQPGTQARTVDIPHVEMPLQIMTVEQKVAQEITKFNLPRAALATLKETYMPILSLDLSVKKNYNVLKDAVTDLRNKRNRLEDKRKELNKEAQDFIAGVNGEAAALKSLIVEMETPLKEKKEEIDGAAEREKQRKEEEKQKRLQGRVATLLSNGMGFNGSYYSIGAHITMDVVTISEMDDQEFKGFNERVIVVNNEIKEEQRLAKEKEDAERAELQRQKDEQAETQRKQEEQQPGLANLVY